MDKDINTLRSKNDNLRVLVEQKNDALEQYSRRNNVRIFGIPETFDGNTENNIILLCNEQLKISIQSSDIESCHRTSQKLYGKMRPVIVKFTSYKFK